MLPNDPFSRRTALRAGLASLIAPGLSRAEPGGDDLGFDLKEEAGIRRFGYPVHTVFPGLASGPPYRLSKNGRDIPAQFRPIAGGEGEGGVSLDFNASLGPHETERYVVHPVKGGGEDAGPREGIRVENSPRTVRVSNGTVLSYAVPDDLLGFLNGVANARLEFLREGSGGLMIRYRDDIHYRVGGKGPEGVPTRTRVTREGPIAAAIRFESLEALRGERSVRSAVEMTFPNSKSWVETSWRVEDPEGYVAGLGLDLRLGLDPRPTLVDLGAGSQVYSTLRGRERIELVAGTAPGLTGGGRPWVVRRGEPDRLTPFVEAPGPDAPKAEGWAHVMDASRCTAAAVGGFGRATRDRIIVDTDGRMQLWRDFAGEGASPPKGPKTLTFWLHFVTMPVQVGAVTSPQSMLAPLKVEWRGAT